MNSDKIYQYIRDLDITICGIFACDNSLTINFDSAVHVLNWFNYQVQDEVINLTNCWAIGTIDWNLMELYTLNLSYVGFTYCRKELQSMDHVIDIVVNENNAYLVFVTMKNKLHCLEN